MEECVCAAQLALYRFTALKKADEDETADPQWLAVAFDGQEVPDAAHAAARRGENAAWAVSLARDLATTPPNLLYPEMLAQKAQELAREKGFACTADETDLEKEGMGCLMAVGQVRAVRPASSCWSTLLPGMNRTSPSCLWARASLLIRAASASSPPQTCTR